MRKRYVVVERMPEEDGEVMRVLGPWTLRRADRIANRLDDIAVEGAAPFDSALRYSVVLLQPDEPDWVAEEAQWIDDEED